MLSFSGLGGLRASSLEASGLHDTKLKLLEIAYEVLREPLINDVTTRLSALIGEQTVATAREDG